MKMDTFGKLVKKALAAKGMNQQTLSIRSGMDAQMISKIVNGRQMPSYSSMVKILNGLEMDIEFVDRKNGKKSVEPRRTVNANGFHYDYCGYCDVLLPVDRGYDKANFCPACGMPVNWSEE